MKAFMEELAELMDRHNIILINKDENDYDGDVFILGPDLEVWAFEEGIDRHTLRKTVKGMS